MTGSHLGRGRLLGAALTLLLLISCVSASAASASPYPPQCPAGTYGGAYPPPACVDTSYVSDSYATALTHSPISITKKLVSKGRYSYVAVDVTVNFSDALSECPGGGVPLSDIPCQMDSASIGIAGRYIARQKDLSTADNPINYVTTGCTPQVPQGVCRYDFRLYEDETPGFSVYVFNVNVGELTQNPANDLGGAGFEWSVGVNVPHLPKPKQTKKTKTRTTARTAEARAAKPTAVKITPGTYVAKAGTSSFRFKVLAHTATNDCGASASAHCFIAITYPKIKAPCTMGAGTEDNAFSVPNGFINSRGRFSYHQTGPLISFSAGVTGGDHWTGTLREVDSLEGFTCDTGVVHWSAKRQ